MKWFLQMWSRILCPALASICGMCSPSRNGSKGGGISLRRVAILWRTAHATIMSHARSGQTLSPRRHWNLDFNIPNVFSILTRVLLCARFNVVCGPGAGLGYGVMSVGRHGYPRSPRIHPSNCPAIKYKLWAILHKHNYMRSMICSECNSPFWNLRLKLDSRYIMASWTEPGHFASTLVIMWEASHII